MIKSDQLINAVHFLEKFKKAIITMFIIVIIASLLVYIKVDDIIAILTKPLNGVQLFFMTPVEGLMTKMKVSFFGGIIISAPLILYKIIALASSKLLKRTIRIIYFVVVPLSIILFLVGLNFGYKLILPSTIKFLLACGNGFMKPTLSGSEYFSFISTLLITIGLIFEVPVVLIALSRIGLVTSKMLMGTRKLAIMLSLISIALVAPALDAFTFILVTSPVIVLYELSIWCIFFLERKKRKNANA
jgi:sec-independent protein translocase protein TatC